jgi:hypothetical protein
MVHGLARPAGVDRPFELTPRLPRRRSQPIAAPALEATRTSATIAARKEMSA